MNRNINIFQQKTPESWKKSKLSEIIEIERGASPRPRSDDSLFGGDIPWIKIGDASRDRRSPITEVESYVTEKGKEKSKFVEKGFIIVANSGATCGFASIVGINGCVHDGWLIPKNYQEKIIRDYFYYYINHNYDYLQLLSTGSAQNNLNTKLFTSLEIEYPEISEQRRIASVLYSVDEKLELLQEREQELTQMKHGLIQDLFDETKNIDSDMDVRKEILPSDEPSEVEGHESDERTIAEITQLRRNSIPSDEQQELPHVGLEHLDEFSLNHTFESSDNVSSNKYRFEEGDILFGQIRSYLKKVCVANRTGVCSTDIFVIQPQNVNRYYLWALLLSDDVNNWSQRASTGTKMPRVQWTPFSKKKVKIPPMWKQERIASVLYTVDEMITQTNCLQKEYEQLKSGLMQDLLSGDVRTPDELEVLDEVAAA